MREQKIPKFVARKRQALSLSQRKLAEQVGVAQATIFYVESGALARFPSRKVGQLARVLKIDPTEFIEMWVNARTSEFEKDLRRKVQFDE